jgi:hypothetical protein
LDVTGLIYIPRKKRTLKKNAVLCNNRTMYTNTNHSIFPPRPFPLAYLSLLASRSDSSKQRISSSRIGPLTLRMIERVVSSMNSTRTWVTLPREPSNFLSTDFFLLNLIRDIKAVGRQTGTTENFNDLHEFNGSFGRLHDTSLEDLEFFNNSQ